MGSKNSSVVTDGILHLRRAKLLGSIYHYTLKSAFLEISLPRTRAGKNICNVEMYFMFMSPCIVIDLFLNNQLDALFIHIYSVINSTCFGHLLCPSSGVFYFTFATGKFHVGF